MEPRERAPGLVIDDRAARSYEEALVPAMLQKWAADLVAFGDLVQGDRVLDVACNTGITARYAVERMGETGTVDGCDPDPAMLAIAREKAPGIRWRECDPERLPYVDMSFDRVLCLGSLALMDDPVAALREMARVVAPSPGGRVAVHVWGESEGYESLGRAIAGEAGAAAAAIFLSPFGLRDLERVRDLFAEAGLFITETDTRYDVARFPSQEAMLELDSLGPPIPGRLDVGTITPAMREAVRPYVEPDGSVQIPVEGHLVRAARQ